MARNREKVVYGRPNNAYRIDYLDIMWVEDCKNRFTDTLQALIYTKLGETINASILKCSKD
jgi:hypothetical protein